MMKEKNQSILELIEKYKVQLKENELKGEIYKWQLLLQFNGRPNLNNESFYEDLLGINYKNLIYYNAGMVMKHLANDRPIQYKRILLELFNENIPLQDRINHFDFEINKLYREIVPEEKISHHHDERTISTLLTYKNPYKYTFFKDSYYQKYCKLIGIPSKSKGEKYTHYLELINDLKNEYIINDQELLDLIHPLLTTGCFSDENYTILAQDILYQILDKSNKINTVIALMASDNTGWQDNTIKRFEGFNTCILWNSKKPSGTTKTLSFLRNIINDGDSFNLYYCSKGFVTYKARIIDFVTNQIELEKSNWNHKYKILDFQNSFSAYTDINKSAKIVFLAESLEKMPQIRVSDFKFYDGYSAPRQDNLSPIMKEPEYTEISSTSQKFNPMNTIKAPLNQILFGPPGTGKTYNSINKALEIIENKTEETLIKESRTEIKKRFENYLKMGQIVFTTFHQSMSYEDFIEGIKPKTIDDAVTYNIEDGVFKRLCNKAKEKNIKSNNFEDAYNKLIQIIDTAPENKLILETLVHSKEFTIYVNSKNNIKFHANTEKAYEGVIKKEVIEHFLKTGEATDWPSYTKSLGNYIIENCNYSQQEIDETKNFVLIIDEINRGNVSQIFGELITLIEDDKRMGEKEALEVTLPYSKEKFGVPSNLHIIGTMNTADRSVEALDSALRRRFSFLETPPLPELLSPGYRYWDLLWEYIDYEWDNKEYVSKEKQMLDFFGASQNIWDTRKELWEEFKKENKDEKQALRFNNDNFTGINLEDILKTMNKRIEKLLDKDHKIGHSYFINVSSMNELKTAFQNKIIPLLQEYFFGDYAKIGLVLGKGFVEKVELKKDNLFADFDKDYESDYGEKQIFYLKNINKMNDGEFKEAITLLLNKINFSS